MKLTTYIHAIILLYATCFQRLILSSKQLYEIGFPITALYIDEERGFLRMETCPRFF